jgi:hypothetical protein
VSLLLNIQFILYEKSVVYSAYVGFVLIESVMYEKSTKKMFMGMEILVFPIIKKNLAKSRLCFLVGEVLWIQKYQILKSCLQSLRVWYIILLEVLIGVRFAPDTTLRYQKSAVWYIIKNPIAGRLSGLFGWIIYCPSSKNKIPMTAAMLMEITGGATIKSSQALTRIPVRVPRLVVYLK